MPAAPVDFNIYPYPLTNLVIIRQRGTTTETITPTHSGSNNYYSVSSFEGTFTISADGYVTVIEEQGEYDSHDVILKPSQLYAWTSNHYYADSSLTIPYTLYTASAAPSSGDALYDSTGTQISSIKCYDNVDYYGTSVNTVGTYSSVNNTINISSGPSSPSPV